MVEREYLAMEELYSFDIDFCIEGNDEVLEWADRWTGNMYWWMERFQFSKGCRFTGRLGGLFISSRG